MKKLFISTIFLLIALFSFAQEGYYNVLLDYTGKDCGQCQHIEETTYTVGLDKITEYYCTKSESIINIHTSGELPHYSSLQFIKNKKGLIGLIKKIGLEKALSFTYDKLTPGMTVEEVHNLLGKPFKMKYSIDNVDQLLHYSYNYGLYSSLVFRNDKLEKIVY